MEGLTHANALKLFYGILTKISKNQASSSQKIASGLLTIIEKTIFLNSIAEAAQSNKGIPSAQQFELANFLLKRWDAKENILLHSGHQGHTFYIGIKKQVINNNVTITFIINNFNMTAVEKNIQVTKNENDFYPHVLRFEISTKVEGSKKGKKRQSFVQEEKQLAQYIAILQGSTVAGQHYIQKHKTPLTRIQKRNLGTIKKELIKNNKEKLLLFFLEIKSKVIDNGFLSLGKFQEYLESTDFDAFLTSSINIWCQIKNDLTLKAHLQQFMQTKICLDFIYTPSTYGLNMFKRDQEFEKTQPSFPLQRIGNCTVFNLKTALYPLAGLDWRKKEDQQKIIQLNFDIQEQIAEIIKKAVPNIEKQMPNSLEISQIPFPFPAGSFHKELGDAIQLRRKNKSIEARDLLLNLCNSNCDDGFVFAELGLIYDNDFQDSKSALQYYLRALEFMDDPEIFLNVAIIYQSSDSNAALRYFSLAAEINPNSSQIYFNQAMMCYSGKDYDGCLNYIKKLILLHPEKPENYLLRGQLLLEIGRKNEGLSDICRSYYLGLRTTDFYFTLVKYHYSNFLELLAQINIFCVLIDTNKNDKDLLIKNYTDLSIQMINIDNIHQFLKTEYGYMEKYHSEIIKVNSIKNDSSIQETLVFLKRGVKKMSNVERKLSKISKLINSLVLDNGLTRESGVLEVQTTDELARSHVLASNPGDILQLDPITQSLTDLRDIFEIDNAQAALERTAGVMSETTVDAGLVRRAEALNLQTASEIRSDSAKSEQLSGAFGERAGIPHPSPVPLASQPFAPLATAFKVVENVATSSLAPSLPPVNKKNGH